MASNIKKPKKTKSQHGPKPLGIHFRVIVTMDEATLKRLEAERDISKMRVTEICRLALINYLDAKERDQAQV